MRRRLVGLALSVVSTLSLVPVVEALEISTGPLRIGSGDAVLCLAANTGSSNIANVRITIVFRRSDGTSNNIQTINCGTLSPSATCQTGDVGLATDYAMFCEATYPGGKLKATLCNETRGVCSNAD